MLKFRIVLFCISICLYMNGFGQDNKFDLSKYKLPDLDRRALETNVNLSGYNHYIKAPTLNYYGYGETSSKQYSGDALVNYSRLINTSKIQRESNLGFAFAAKLYNIKGDGEVREKNNNILPSLYYQLENRKYYDGLSFIESDLNLNYIYGSDKTYSNYSMYSPPTTDQVKINSFLFQLPLKLGRGRIEPVQDARHALYILDELTKVGRTSAGKSDEQIIQFANLISQLKNKRFFDSRLRKMEEIESVDSFLVAQKFISQQDARYYTTLNDFWEFGDRPLRNCGTRYSLVVLPGYYYYDLNNPENGNMNFGTQYTFNALLLDGGLEINNEKAFNLYWQNTINISGFFGVIEGEIKDKASGDHNNIRIPDIKCSIQQRIGYYPNTRTSVSFRYLFQYIKLIDKTNIQKEIIGAEGRGLKALTDLSVKYYISPKVRLDITASLYYIWQESNDEVIFNFDDSSGRNFLLSNIAISNAFNYDYFKSKELVNDFKISLVYSIF